MKGIIRYPQRAASFEPRKWKYSSHTIPLILLNCIASQSRLDRKDSQRVFLGSSNVIVMSKLHEFKDCTLVSLAQGVQIAAILSEKGGRQCLPTSRSVLCA